MRMILAAIAAVALTPAAQAAAPPSVFDAFMDPAKPCEKMADIAKVGPVMGLSKEQFQFVRALYVALPPMSKTFPIAARANKAARVVCDPA